MSAEAGFMPEVHALLAGRSAERLAGVRFVVLGHGVSGSFSGPQIEGASGVSEVEIDGPILRCLVCGSFQPFLEALRGHEVISLKAASTHSTSESREGRSTSPFEGGQ